MKKNLIILSLLVFFVTGMIAQAPATEKKECTKTEAKADCPKAKKEGCTKDATKCDKAEAKKCADKSTAEKKACCDVKKS
jgi:Na+-transporting methylmalonyl-CoA/oxaloacetate decarboxylase gamma subunit